MRGGTTTRHRRTTLFNRPCPFHQPPAASTNARTTASLDGDTGVIHRLPRPNECLDTGTGGVPATVRRRRLGREEGADRDGRNALNFTGSLTDV